MTLSRRRKWKWAGHVARRTDGRWSAKILEWRPKEGHRTVGRPRARWRDDLDVFIRTIEGANRDDWIVMAQDRTFWGAMGNSYVSGVRRKISENTEAAT